MEAVSLQDLIRDIGIQLGELATGTTTAVGTNTTNFIDTNFASAATSYLDDEWVGSQVLFLEPAYTVAGCINGDVPHTINDFVASTGTFASGLAFRGSSVVPAGLSYLLFHPRGQGRTFDQYIAAIRYACDRLNVRTTGVNVALTTAADDYDYTIPAGLGWVYDVWLTKSGYYPARLTPAQWELHPGRTLWLRWDVDVRQALGIKLFGFTEDPIPTDIDSTLVCDRAEVVDLAVEYLRAGSPDSAENARGDRKTSERLRFRRSYDPPNLRRVLP